MSGIRHDLFCEKCGIQEWNVVKCEEDYLCEGCGRRRAICYDRWGGMNVDLFTTPQFSDATGEWHSSQRDKERKMADLGYTGCGDKNHGGRPDLSMKNAAFSYSGQKSHISTGERS